MIIDVNIVVAYRKQVIDLRWNYRQQNWGHFVIQVARGVSPQSPMVKTTTTSHNHLRYTWPGIRLGQKDFHHSRTLHKKKYSLLRREVNEEKNLRRTFEALFRKFLHSRNICLREMNRPTNR